MEIIGGQKIWTFVRNQPVAVNQTCGAIRKGPAHRVRNFMDLATKVAELQFRNRDFVLMFRGQGGDYRNLAKATSIKSTLMRASARRASCRKPRSGRASIASRRPSGCWSRNIATAGFWGATIASVLTFTLGYIFLIRHEEKQPLNVWVEGR